MEPNQENYSTINKPLENCTNAWEFTRKFAEITHNCDREFMEAWFATAIEAGRRLGQRISEAEAKHSSTTKVKSYTEFCLKVSLAIEALESAVCLAEANNWKDASNLADSACGYCGDAVEVADSKIVDE